jgi:hypothetical protein
MVALEPPNTAPTSFSGLKQYHEDQTDTYNNVNDGNDDDHN